MKKTFALLATTSFVSLSLMSPAAHAQSKDLAARIAAMEEEIKILKRQNEVQQEEAKAKAEKTANVELNKKGLSITSADKRSNLKLRGNAQAVGRFFVNDEVRSDTDTLLLKRVRPILEATIEKDFYLRISPDFAGGTFRLMDAYAEYRADPAFNIRLGKFKTPIALERLQSDSDTLFIERGLTSNLTPSRDVGLAALGSILGSKIEYQLGVFNGNADGANTETDDDSGKEVAARIFALPFKGTDHLGLQNLGFGIGGSYGGKSASSATTQLGEYRTPGQQRFFRYSTGTYADGNQWRVSPQAYYYTGPVGILGEYVMNSTEVARTATTRTTLQNDAWQLVGSYLLTGEDATYGKVKPLQNFDLNGKGWGAFELVGRVGELNIDDDAFPLYSTATESARKAFSIGTGVNWHLNENAKISINYDHTSFDGGAAAGADRKSEQVIQTGFHIEF